MKQVYIFSLVCSSLVFSCPSTKEKNIAQDHITRHLEIYAAHDEYCAWPSIIRAKNGDLLVTFCRTEEHLGPDGQIALMRSKDNGTSWQGPEIIYDSILDDRESGLTTLNDGTIITHYWSHHFTKEAYENLSSKSYPKFLLDKWIKHVEAPDYKNAIQLQSGWVSVSKDNGHTWSQPKKGPDTIHGGVQLVDGTLMVASYREHDGNIGIYTAKSADQDWEQLTTFVCPETDSIRFGEPHVLQLHSGRILMMVRSTAKPYNDSCPTNYLWETYSDDNGRTWVDLFATNIWGFPPHLLLLADGRILCTYGYRRPPFGQRAWVSEDGITWDIENELILRDDAFNTDLGYPASVEIEPGVVLSVYYQSDPTDGPQQMHPPDPNRSRPDILGTVWRVPECN